MEGLWIALLVGIGAVVVYVAVVAVAVALNVVAVAMQVSKPRGDEGQDDEAYHVRPLNRAARRARMRAVK